MLRNSLSVSMCRKSTRLALPCCALLRVNRYMSRYNSLQLVWGRSSSAQDS